MNRKKRPLAIVAVLLVLLIGLPCWLAYRQVLSLVEQARKDQALITAIKAQNEDQVRELLQDGASANAIDTGERASFGQALRQWLKRLHHPVIQPAKRPSPSALALAIWIWMPNSFHTRNDAIVLSLLEHGANPNDQIMLDRDNDTITLEGEHVPVLAYASHWGKRSASVRKLLEMGANPNARFHPYDETPLMWADAQSTDLMIVHGADVDATDGFGDTALMQAVVDDDLDKVRTLLQHGAKVSVKNNRGRTAKMMFVDYRHHQYAKILALLRQYGAKE